MSIRPVIQESGVTGDGSRPDHLSCPPVQGKLDEAIDLYLKALAIFEKVKGESSTQVATVSKNIALLYKKQVL